MQLQRILMLALVIGLIGASCSTSFGDDDGPTQTPIFITPTPQPATPTEVQAQVEPSPTLEAMATIAPPPTIEPTTVVEPGPTAEPTSVPTTAPSPTSEPDTTATATFEPSATGDVELLQSGFGQAAPGETIDWAFIIQNTNAEFAIEDVDYRVVLFDEAGVAIETEERGMPLIMPGQRTGIASTTFVEDGVSAATMTVEISTGEAVQVDQPTTFLIDSVNYFPDEDFPRVTGLVNNPLPSMVSDLRVSAISFDSEGNISGGGFTFLGAAASSAQTGVNVSIGPGLDVASVEMFADPSFLSEIIEPNPETDPVVSQFGFGHPPDDPDPGWGALIQNPSLENQIERLELLVWFQDAEGRVLSATSEFVPLLPPGQTIGVGDYFSFLPDGTVASSMSVLVMPGTSEPSQITTWFTAENASYIEDDFFPEVRGTVNNPFPIDLEDLYATAIAYDEAGAIIGGGFSFVDLVLANGSTDVSISVTTSTPPARVEIYAYPSSLTDFEP